MLQLDSFINYFPCTLVLIAASVFAVAEEASAPSKETPIDLAPFADGIAHWQKHFGRDRNDPRFEPNEIVAIGDNMLRFQNADGGWPKDIDWLLNVPEAEIRAVRGNAVNHSSFDNRNTYSQIGYLAELFTRTGLDRFRTSAERGIEYVLREQRQSGGWRGADVDAITYNDDVCTGIMHLLLDIIEPKPHFAWVHPATRSRCDSALQRILDATLRCQIIVDGRKTGWCQQHDHASYLPVRARTYELPSICPAESTAIVYVLMRLTKPSTEVLEAIDAAVAWMDDARIENVRIDRVPIEPVRFKSYTAYEDVVASTDPGAPSLWTRYYEIDTNRPFFCNRDGIKVYSLAEVELERRAGYGWYGRWPAKLIEQDYPAWKAQHAAAR